jgi:hypothetical protein
MPTPTNPPRPLANLLTELEAAVRASDHARATQLEQTILQRLASEAADRACLERRVRALMTALDQPAAGPRVSILDPFNLERSSSLPAADGVVYPVWFGTNRKPEAQGDGFTGERHDRITRGRVEVLCRRCTVSARPVWASGDVCCVSTCATTACGSNTWRGRSGMPSSRTSTRRCRPRDSGEQPHALFFLHGFNVTFTDAAIRAAQIGYDLKVSGATAFCSWPSRGSVAAYPVDEASIEASEQAITDFLVDFTA